MKPFVNQRLKTFIDELKIKQITLAEDVGKTKQFIGQWFRDENPTPVPNEDIFLIIFKYKKLNARWFLTGEGPMLTEDNQSNIIDGFKITEVGCPLCNPREREIITQNKLIALLEENIKDLKSSQNKKPTEKIGYKSDEPGIDKAAETTGKYKVTNLRQLKLNANLSDRVD